MPGPVLAAGEKSPQAMHVSSVLLLLQAHLHSDLLLHFSPFPCFDQLWVMILEKICFVISVLPKDCQPKERREKKKGKSYRSHWFLQLLLEAKERVGAGSFY